MQDQINSMNDSREVQEVDSNYSVRLLYVSSQLAMGPSSSSMLSRDKRLPLDTWNTIGLQENVFAHQFSTFDSPRDLPQRVQYVDMHRNREAVPEVGTTKSIHTSEDRENHGTIQCRQLQQSRGVRVQQYRWNYRDFPNFEMLDAKIASASDKIIQNSHFQNYHFKKKVSLEEKKAQKEGRFPRGRQIAFMIYDSFRVTGAHDTILDCADLFSVSLHDDNIQEFDTRWDEVLLSM